jgi:hypothetical protein
METCIEEATAAEKCRRQQFSLPFVNQTVRLDDAGARFVAWLACRLAIANAGPLGTEKQYACRIAAFLCGCISAQCMSDVQRIRIFQDFLPGVDRYLNRSCSHCRDEKGDEDVSDALLVDVEELKICRP